MTTAGPTSARTSVVVPALNEEPTIAAVVESLLADHPLEVIVIDADSTDRTAQRAQETGATVLNWREILPTVPTRPGKGESLWRGVLAARGDFVMFCDADLTCTQPGMVNALSAPLEDDSIHLVKAAYIRALDGQPGAGGRVTALTARPLVRLCFPELEHISQPLGGEYVLRRSTALTLPFVDGYGVESGLIIDVAHQYGPGAVTEVDLGVRHHRNRPLEELAPMADTVAATILARAGMPGCDITQRPPLIELHENERRR